jgi:hypothetical protein
LLRWITKFYVLGIGHNHRMAAQDLEVEFFLSLRALLIAHLLMIWKSDKTLRKVTVARIE